MTAETWLKLSNDERAAGADAPFVKGLIAWLEMASSAATSGSMDEMFHGNDNQARSYAGMQRAYDMTLAAIRHRRPPEAPAEKEEPFYDPALPPSLLKRKANAVR